MRRKAADWSGDSEMRVGSRGGWELHPQLRKEYMNLFGDFPPKETRGQFAHESDARAAAQRVWNSGQSRFYALHYERNRRRKSYATEIARESGRSEWDNDVQDAAEMIVQAEQRRQRKGGSAVAVTASPYRKRGGRPRGAALISDAELLRRYRTLEPEERASYARAAQAVRASLPPQLRRMSGAGIESLRKRLGRLVR